MVASWQVVESFEVHRFDQGERGSVVVERSVLRSAVGDRLELVGLRELGCDGKPRGKWFGLRPDVWTGLMPWLLEACGVTAASLRNREWTTRRAQGRGGDGVTCAGGASVGSAKHGRDSGESPDPPSPR